MKEKINYRVKRGHIPDNVPMSVDTNKKEIAVCGADWIMQIEDIGKKLSKIEKRAINLVPDDVKLDYAIHIAFGYSPDEFEPQQHYPSAKPSQEMDDVKG